MIKRRTKYPVQLSLAVFAIALTYFGPTILTEQFIAFSQQQSEQIENDDKTDSGSNIGEIQLHPFTFWEKLKAATLVYINPLAPTDISVIYVYDFMDSEEIIKALSQISTENSEILMENWYIGQVAQEASDSKSAIWRPAKLNEFNWESGWGEVEPAVASTCVLPGKKSADTYWF